MREKETIKNVIKNKGIVSEPDYRDLGAVLLFIFLLPYLISFFFGNVGEAAGGIKRESTEKNAEFAVCNTTEKGTETMPLEVYLVNRLPATIDMDYEEEALKAQAVVLRTEMMRLYYESGKAKQITVESTLSQVEGEVYEKAKRMIAETKGMYIVYEGIPVKAPYFAISAGATRNGNEALQSEEYAYLRSVICERDFMAEDYVQSKRMSKRTFYERLEEAAASAEKPAEGKGEYGETSDEDANAGKTKDMTEIIFLENEEGTESRVCLERDMAGYVKSITVGNQILSGEVFRAAFFLNSSCFEVEEDGDDIRIQTKGVGHGLGLCQYGANEAAKKGSDFIDILNYFFSDVVIEKTE